MIDKRVCRGMSVPPSGWPQTQLEEMEIYMASKMLVDFPADPVLAAAEFSGKDRKELQQAVYKMLYDAAPKTVNTQHKPNSLGTDYGEGCEGREVGQKLDAAEETGCRGESSRD